jgi:hypothetical protein
MQVRRQPIRRATPKLRHVQIYALVLMFLCVMAVISLGESSSFAARRLVVQGATFTGDATVSRIVGMGGSPNVFRLHTDRIAAALAALPAVESASVEVRLPDTIVVTIVERDPKLVWVIGDRRFVVDDTGFLFGEVDTAGNPVNPTAGAPATVSPSEPGAEASASDSSSTASESPSDAGSGSPDASTTDPPNGRVAQPGKVTPAPKSTPKVTPKPTPKPTPTPKVTPKPSASVKATLAPGATPTPALLPSLLPVPAADPAQTPGPEVVNKPVVYDRRDADANLTLGDVIDPIALDAGYRLAGLTPTDVGSQAPSLDVVLDDTYGFTVGSGSGGWVAEFGFYTETLRKDTVIPTQVRDLRSMLLHYGENHVAWVWLVADIADNHIDTYISR